VIHEVLAAPARDDRSAGLHYSGRISTAACAIALAALSACTASTPATAPTASQSLPQEYLGKWYYTGSSGGITGEGGGDAAAGYWVIQSDGTIDLYQEDGALIGSTRFTVARGPTIFSRDEQWILEREGGIPEVITVSSDGKALSLAENVYDGFLRTYVRAR